MGTKLARRCVVVRSRETRAAQRAPVFNATAPAERQHGLVHARAAINWQDELESVEEKVQDVELRRLVDCLPSAERHMVERCYFGGVSARQAADELELAAYRGERLLRAGLAQLREWLEGGVVPRRDPDRKRTRIPKRKEPKTRAFETLDDAAMETTMSGRYRGDGRRLDSYTPYENEGWTVIPIRHDPNDL